MLALLNGLWFPLNARRRGSARVGEQAFSVRSSDLGELRDLVASEPGISLQAQGLFACRCKVTGSPEAMAEFLPRLRAWQHDCESSDAW